jgi:hypothetical protein
VHLARLKLAEAIERCVIKLKENPLRGIDLAQAYLADGTLPGLGRQIDAAARRAESNASW